MVLQAPLVVGAGYVTTAEHAPVVFGTVIFAGQVIVQAGTEQVVEQV